MRKGWSKAVPAVLAGLVLMTSVWMGKLKADVTTETPSLKLKVGDVAPDFSLRDQNGKSVSLKDFRGKKSVALAFYVFAFTGG